MPSYCLVAVFLRRLLSDPGKTETQAASVCHLFLHSRAATPQTDLTGKNPDTPTL